MKLKSVMHSVFLGLAILGTYIWTKDPILSLYNLQLTGALVILYFVFRVISTSKHSSINETFPSTIIMTAISMLLIFSTGGMTSPLFFILDFLLFALALLFEPVQAAISSVIIVSIFIWSSYTNINTQQIINLISLALMTPLAIVFSRTYLKNLESAGKIKVLELTIKKEEMESLLWISKTAKPSISSVLNSVTDLVIYFNTKGQDIPKGLSEKLKAIQNDLITLYSSTGDLEKNIKDASDNIKK